MGEQVQETVEDTAADVIKRTEDAVRRLEEATAKHEKSRLLAEEARAKAMLAGQAEAGVKPVKKEETPKEYKDRIMRGEYDPE